MKILMLGPYREHMIGYLRSQGDDVVQYEKRITPDSEILEDVDFVVSYGYQFIIKDDVLARFPRRAVNLHISLLPWNKGRDPNLWSFLENTPKGVTIHYIDKGVDTGYILAQREVSFDSSETLRSSYAALSDAIERLFMDVWPEIRSGTLSASPQPPGGTYHRGKDKVAFEHLLHSGWDTPVGELIGKGTSEMEALEREAVAGDGPDIG